MNIKQVICKLLIMSLQKDPSYLLQNIPFEIGKNLKFVRNCLYVAALYCLYKLAFRILSGNI